MRGRRGSRSVRVAYATPVVLVVAVLMFTGPVAASAGMHAGSSTCRRSWPDRGAVHHWRWFGLGELCWDHADQLRGQLNRSRITPDAPNWDGFVDLAWFGRDWWAVARPSGVFAGRIGGPLRELPLLHKCNPGSSSREPGVVRRSMRLGGASVRSARKRSALRAGKHRLARWSTSTCDRIAGMSLHQCRAPSNTWRLPGSTSRSPTGALRRTRPPKRDCLFASWTPRQAPWSTRSRRRRTAAAKDRAGCRASRLTRTETCSSPKDAAGRLRGSWPMSPSPLG